MHRRGAGSAPRPNPAGGRGLARWDRRRRSKDWSKEELIREVERLRAILHEHADSPADAPTSGGSITDVAGDPHAFGGVVLDTRNAVLMDYMDVSLVDTKRGDPPSMVMVLEGRRNLRTERTKQMFMFGPDGAAALVSELVGIAQRAGGEFRQQFAAALNRRLEELP